MNAVVTGPDEVLQNVRERDPHEGPHEGLGGRAQARAHRRCPLSSTPNTRWRLVIVSEFSRVHLLTHILTCPEKSTDGVIRLVLPALGIGAKCCDHGTQNPSFQPDKIRRLYLLTSALFFPSPASQLENPA